MCVVRLAHAVIAASVSIGCSVGGALGGGCTRSEAGPVAAERPLGSSPEARAEEVVLDRRADGARIVGQLRPAPPGSDADRVLVIRLERDGRQLMPAFEGARVLDARFVGERLVVLGDDHVLRVAGEGEQLVELDRNAEAPLAVRGEQVAYVRGDMPFFEVALADLATGAVRAITEGYAPAWSPALSDDGSIVFVSSREGSPRLHRAQPDGQVVALAPSPRTPSSPEAPWLERTQTGELLHFRDEEGPAVLDLATGRLASVSTP